ncbi:hypothetical protein [Bacillus paranthracis]|uniref:hypothetical protein n=1 Tax=Bacillus paranthracis TaxID=2026186 RepID=UPI0013D57E39|nr:hypothetical protein [Bacillus paranthracis]
MGLKEIMEVAKSEYVFTVLFILGLAFLARLVNQILQKSYEREEKLMNHQTEMTKQLSDISSTQTKLQTSIDKLEQRTEENFRQLWQAVKR